MDGRDWTDDAELLCVALDAGATERRYHEPDENHVTIDGTYDATAVINAIRLSALGTLTTVEELEQVPILGAVVDADGMVAQRMDEHYWSGCERAWDAGQIALPARLLYVPPADRSE